MIKIHVSVEILGQEEPLLVTLPCANLSTLLSGAKEGEYQITDWDVNFPYEDDFDDIYKLNLALNRVNTAVPEMDTELLAQILIETDNLLTDQKFLDQLCRSDFMLDEIKYALDGDFYSVEEQCAHYLAVDIGVPFAKDITDTELLELASEDSSFIFWDVIWHHYSHMGFIPIFASGKIYVSHWG